MNTTVKRPERKHWHHYEMDDDDFDVTFGIFSDDEDEFMDHWMI
jgi:hypothetical protein